jgi:hypothetical protein
MKDLSKSEKLKIHEISFLRPFIHVNTANEILWPFEMFDRV